MKPKVRTKPMSWSSVSRNTRTACTSTSTATVAAMGAGTLKMGSRGLAADCSIKMAPDACQIGGGRCRNKRYDRRNWLPSPNKQKGGPGSSLLQPARMPNETPGYVWARPGAVTPFASCIFVVKTLSGHRRGANLNLLLSLTCRQALWLAPAWHGRGRADSYRALAKALPMPTTGSQAFYLTLN